MCAGRPLPGCVGRRTSPRISARGRPGCSPLRCGRLSRLSSSGRYPRPVRSADPTSSRQAASERPPQLSLRGSRLLCSPRLARRPSRSTASATAATRADPRGTEGSTVNGPPPHCVHSMTAWARARSGRAPSIQPLPIVASHEKTSSLPTRATVLHRGARAGRLVHSLFGVDLLRRGDLGLSCMQLERAGLEGGGDLFGVDRAWLRCRGWDWTKLES